MTNKILPILLLLSLISTCIEVDIAVPSFVDIAHYFGVSQGLIQQTITYNFIGYFIGALFYGPLSDSYGRRNMMLVGNALLSIGALGCVLAFNIDMLLISRFIQGVGASTSFVLVFTIIADLYDGYKATRLIGLMNASLAIIMAMAPIAGGIINETIGWRGNYGSVAMLSIITWVLLFVFLPESRKHFTPFKLTKVLKDYKKLLLSRRHMTGSLIPSLMFAGYMAYIAGSAFLYINTFGLTTLTFVCHQAVIVASFAITSIYVNKIIPLFGSGNSVKYGILLSFISILMFILLSYYQISSPYLTTCLISLFGIGFAICYPIVFSDSLSVFPELKGAASSLIMSLRALLVSFTTGINSFIYNGEPLVVALAISVGVFSASVLTIFWLMSIQSNKEEYSA